LVTNSRRLFSSSIWIYLCFFCVIHLEIIFHRTVDSLFRYCFWPFWVPCMSLNFDCRSSPLISTSWHQKIQKIVLRVLALCGIGLSIFMLISLFKLGLDISTHDGHIVYQFTPLFSLNPIAITAPYLACTVLPFSLMRLPYGWTLSVAIGISAIIAYALYSSNTFPSTWCFFAAWISIHATSIRVWDILHPDHCDSTCPWRDDANTSEHKYIEQT
jgi:hypothetical protein